ncbi:MAG: alpha/beta hydrolase [Porphyromonas sp.]|nr:alpha/beta hydrolase [Porphyromonas sp.]
MKSRVTATAYIEYKTLEHKDYSIHYFVSGNPNNNTIVFIHPAFGDHTCFNKQIDFFSSEYRVITLDMLGHGLSELGKSKDKIISTSTHIAKILDQEEIDKAHIVGVSLGSLIAQDFALRYSNRTFSVTVLGGYNINQEQKEIAKAQNQEIFKWLFKMLFSMDAFRRYIAETCVVGKDEQMLFYQSTKHFTRNSFRAMSGMGKLVKERPYIKNTYPILILVGDQDIPIAISSAQQWAQAQANSQFYIIKNAGHCANLDNAERFNQLLMDFVKERNSSNSSWQFQRFPSSTEKRFLLHSKRVRIFMLSSTNFHHIHAEKYCSNNRREWNDCTGIIGKTCAKRL